MLVPVQMIVKKMYRFGDRHDSPSPLNLDYLFPSSKYSRGSGGWLWLAVIGWHGFDEAPPVVGEVAIVVEGKNQSELEKLLLLDLCLIMLVS